MYMKKLKEYAESRKGRYHYLGRGVAVTSMADAKGNLWCVVGYEDRKGQVARPVAYLISGDEFTDGDGNHDHEAVVNAMLQRGLPLVNAYGLDGGRELRKLLLCERFTRPDNDGNPIDADWYVDLHAKEGLTVITRDDGHGHVPTEEELEEAQSDDEINTRHDVAKRFGHAGVAKGDDAAGAAAELLEQFGKYTEDDQ